MAAIFLMAVIAVIGIAVRQAVNPDYDEYDMQVLTQDLQQFAGQPGDPSTRIDVQPCTGEGSVSAAAQRRYVAPGTIATVEKDVVAEATSLGWVATPPPEGLPPLPGLFTFEQGDRDLFIGLTMIDESRVEVDLSVTGGDAC
ncbi:MAG: hypothetical protein ABIX10_05760 [Acidimicrobiales bacterium]